MLRRKIIAMKLQEGNLMKNSDIHKRYIQEQASWKRNRLIGKGITFIGTGIFFIYLAYLVLIFI